MTIAKSRFAASLDEPLMIFQAKVISGFARSWQDPRMMSLSKSINVEAMCIVAAVTLRYSSCALIARSVGADNFQGDGIKSGDLADQARTSAEIVNSTMETLIERGILRIIRLGAHESAEAVPFILPIAELAQVAEWCGCPVPLTLTNFPWHAVFPPSVYRGHKHYSEVIMAEIMEGVRNAGKQGLQ